MQQDGMDQVVSGPVLDLGTMQQDGMDQVVSGPVCDLETARNGYSYHLRERETAAQRSAEPPGSSALLQAWEALDVDGSGMLSHSEAAGLRKLLNLDLDLAEAWDRAVRLFESQEAVDSDGTPVVAPDDKPEVTLGGELDVQDGRLETMQSGSLESQETPTQIAFGSFVQLYNLHMGAQRRKHRLEVKVAFDKLDSDHSGTINKQQLHTLVKRNSKHLYLLPPKFELDRDWGYLTSGCEEDPDNPFLGVSWDQFERWWKNRCGLTESNTAIVPEFFTRQLGTNNSLGKRNSANRDGQTGRGPTRGQALWRFLIPRVKALAIMNLAWAPKDGSDANAQAHAVSMYTQSAIPATIRDPDSTFSAIWDVVQVVFLLYVSITVPYRASFGIEVELFSFTWFWDTMIDIYFISDMLLNFRTAYTDSEGMQIVSPRKIASRYAQGWFALDFISCIPVGHISTIMAHAQETQGEAGADNMRALKAIRLLRMSKMLRLARIKRILRKYESLMIVQEYIGAGFALATVVFVAHFLTCLWYLVGLDNDIVVAGRGSQLGRPGVWADPRSTTVISWVNNQPWFERDSTQLNVSISTRYIASMYFVLNALDGYGQTDNEKVMAVIALVFTIVIKGTVAGMMSSMLVSLGGKEQQMNDALRGINGWLAQARVPRPAVQHTLDYFRHQLRAKIKINDVEAMNYMPPGMRAEFTRHIYTRFVDCVPVFRNLPEEVRLAICAELNSMVAMKGQVVCEEGSVGLELYMLMHGECEVTSGGIRLGFLSDGSFFGEVPLLERGTFGGARRRTVTAIVETHLCFITPAQVQRLRDRYPPLELNMRRIARAGTRPAAGRSKGRKAAQARQIKQAISTGSAGSILAGADQDAFYEDLRKVELSIDLHSSAAIARACDSFETALGALAPARRH